MLNPKAKILSRDKLEEKICVVVGTRPGIIKMSPIIRELSKRKIPFFILHTGQHYSYEMDRKFFEDLGLPDAKHHLPPCREGSFHGEQTAHMLAGIESVLLKERPRLVLVCGDANTNLAGALAARKLHIEVGHVESGLRSHDWRMPEEHNRVIIDHISEYLFAPTKQAKDNLIKDNVKGKIYVTGNTVVDALCENIEIAKRKSDLLDQLELNPKNYILLTFHREENVDIPETLAMIIKGLELISKEIHFPIIFPIHPRTKKRIDGFGLTSRLKQIINLKIINPVGYLDFLILLNSAALVLTDSGGIQEESCILRVPCVTLRVSTERPETVTVGANILCGINPEDILKAAQQSLVKKREWPNPFGDGLASKRIINAITDQPVDEWSQKIG